MEILFDLIVAIVDAIRKRNRTPSRVTAAPRPVAQPPATMAAPVAPPIVMRRVPPGSASVRPPVPAPVPAAVRAERLRVDALFASPQALGAAIVASEILQPPVALRR
jgi:hypothetical protein